MSDQYADYSISDLQDEISSTQVLISSLSGTVGQDASRRKSTLEQELKLLESLLDAKLAEEQTRQYREDLKFLDESQAGAPSQDVAAGPGTHNQFRQNTRSDPPLPTSGFSPYAGHGHVAFGHFASDGALGRLGSNGVPAGSNHSRKRPRESLNLSSPTNAHVSKALRTTPSPAETLPTTPSSIESFDFPDNPELHRLLGGNPKEDMREMRKEQKAQEKLLQEKREQERRDEAYARQLMQEDLAIVAPKTPPVWNDRNRFPRATSQTVMDAQGRVRHPEPSLWLTSSPPPPPPPLEQNSPRITRRATPQETPVRRTSTQSSTRYENSQLLPTQSSFNADDFIDLGSDDDDEEFANSPAVASDDLVLVAPPTPNPNNGDGKPQRTLPWMDNSSQGRHFRTYTPTGAGQGRSSEGLSSKNAVPHSYSSPYQRSEGYGGSNVYDAISNPAIIGSSSSWGSVWGRVGESIANAARGVYNPAYGLLDSDIARVPAATPGYGSSAYAYGTAGSSTNPHLIPDIDLEDYSRPSQSLFESVLSNHAIDVDDPGNRVLVDQVRDRYNYLRNDPTRTSAEIKSLLENIRPDEDLPPEDREGTPDAMTYPLMEHQKLGLAWMKSMEEGLANGGILADDMGLGKTIQALALMVSRRSLNPSCKTTLIVAPVALMKQWEREIEQKLKPGREHRLTSYVLHGANRQASWEQLKHYDVVLTTFGTLANELKRKQGIDMQKRVNPNWRPISKADNLPLLGDECKWYRVIIDEAQCIKNKNTKAALGAAQLQSLTRFCMTGTPMMNNVTELYSLIHFLRIKPYNVAENFHRDFTKELKSANPNRTDKAMRKFQALLKAILLRRTKKSQIAAANDRPGACGLQRG